MQKLVTIHLHSKVYATGFFGSSADAQGTVEEHLSQELADGWSIVQITGFGGMNEYEVHAGWLAVVLEKPNV